MESCYSSPFLGCTCRLFRTLKGLWERRPEGRAHLVNWEVFLKPWESGGLSIRDLQLCNEAPLVKWLWYFRLEPDSLWQRIIMSLMVLIRVPRLLLPRVFLFSLNLLNALSGMGQILIFGRSFEWERNPCVLHSLILSFV